MGEAKRRVAAMEAEAVEVMAGIELEAAALGTFLAGRRAAGASGATMLTAMMDAMAAEWVALSIEATGAVPGRREIGTVLVALSGLVEDACLAAAVRPAAAQVVPEAV